jgi:NTE family protein
MRGAYEVGVVAGLVDVLRDTPHRKPLFDLFSGTSVGAINATYFAANADRGRASGSRITHACVRSGSGPAA